MRRRGGVLNNIRDFRRGCIFANLHFYVSEMKNVNWVKEEDSILNKHNKVNIPEQISEIMKKTL